MTCCGTDSRCLCEKRLEADHHFAFKESPSKLSVWDTLEVTVCLLLL